MTFGERLQRARLSAKLTQKQLGARLGVTNSAISGWETDREYPSFTVLPKLKEVLHSSLDELICGTRDAGEPMRAVLNIMEEKAHYAARPDSHPECAQDAKEFALLLYFRDLAQRRKNALIDLIKPER